LRRVPSTARPHPPPAGRLVCTGLTAQSRRLLPRRRAAILISWPLFSPAWMPTNTMKSSGVSRFLSRRDKHHERRSSKTPPNSKVRLHSSDFCSSLTRLLRRPSDTCLEHLWGSHGRHSQSLEALYHKLPSALRTSVEDGFLFFQRSTPSRTFLTSQIAQSSLQYISDHLLPQSHPSHHVSPDLYTIFTNEDLQTAMDKDVDKKVRVMSRACHWVAG
jgi:hypothetical protein